MNNITNIIKVLCSNCNTTIAPNFTEKDLTTKESIVVTCSNCGHAKEAQTAPIIKELQNRVIQELEKSGFLVST